MFHNFERFESHCLLTHIRLHGESDSWKVSIIASNTEKIKALRLGPYRFKDSCLFLNSSLDYFVDQLKMSKDARGKKFYLKLNSPLCKRGKDVNWEKYDLLMAKATLLYENIKNMGSLKEEFPSHSKFYGSLRGRNISEKSYRKMHHIYKKFDCKNMGDFIKIYTYVDM